MESGHNKKNSINLIFLAVVPFEFLLPGMDSLRRKITKAPQPIMRQTQKAVPIPPIIKKREELFISSKESEQMEKNGKKMGKRFHIKKILWIVASIILVIILSVAAYFFWKTYSISKKMNSQTGTQTTLSQDMRALVSPIVPISKDPLNGEADGRINILLMGAAGEHKPGGNLTDTIMIMSIDTKNKKIALLSLPRDFYVPIPGSDTYTKINSLYPIGIKNNQGADMIKATVEKITGLTINYYMAIDFDGFQKIIDDIGGVNITSDRDIYDATYPGPNYSYQTFSLSKGFHSLDGATTLEYVRERHDDPQGDFGRALRQQQVIQAVKNKMFSMQTFFNVVGLNNVLDTLGDNIRTDITFDDIDKFITLSKTLDLQNITNVVVDAWKPDSLMKVSHVQVGAVSAFILVPRVGNYSEIQDLAQNIFDQDELKKRQTAITDENANIGIINESGNSAVASKVKALLTDKLGMKNVSVIPSANAGFTDTTTVNDLSSGQKVFTLDELIKKLPAKLSTDDVSVANNSEDIVITLGSDIVDSYKYDDANIDDYNKAQDQEDNTDLTQTN